MKDEQKTLFTDEIIEAAAQRFALNLSSLKKLDGFENMVLEATRRGKPYILRLTDSARRAVNQVRAELDWLDFLALRDVSVCKPLRSKNDTLVEVIINDKAKIIAVVFERAKGFEVLRENWTEAMTFNRGKLLGQMHTLTKQYNPPSGTITRMQWFEDNDISLYNKYLSPNDDIVVHKFSDLIDELRSIPTDIDSFGLIHMDAHTGNMYFDGDSPTLFDFDDCSYDFFISDIVIAFFYSILMLPSSINHLDYAKGFLNTFLNGYRIENSLDDQWLELIPLILKRREIVLYVAIHRGCDMDNLDAWCTRYLDGRRKRIEEDIPVLDLDWSEFRLS